VNEAAERLRVWIEELNPSVVDALDAALAEERRHVIEQIRERYLRMATVTPGNKGGERHAAVLRILDDLSTPEQER
jgi:hypothetical protein